MVHIVHYKYPNIFWRFRKWLVEWFVVKKKKKNQFQWWKESKGQIYTIAASCLLYLAEDHDVWDPQKQRAFGIAGIGAKIFFLIFFFLWGSSPLKLCFSKHWKQRNKVLKVTRNTREIQDRLKRKTIHQGVYRKIWRKPRHKTNPIPIPTRDSYYSCTDWHIIAGGD